MPRVASSAPSEAFVAAQQLAHATVTHSAQVAAANGTPMRVGHQWPVMARQVNALRDRAHYKFLDACPHLRQQEPEPAYWIAAQPDTLHCFECAPDALRAYAIPALLAILAGGTADDAPHPICVSCRQRRPDVQLVVDVVGCIVAAVHLCEDCLKVDDE